MKHITVRYYSFLSAQRGIQTTEVETEAADVKARLEEIVASQQEEAQQNAAKKKNVPVIFPLSRHSRGFAQSAELP